MYKNLLCEMKLNKVSISDISKQLNIHRNTISRKIFEQNTQFKMLEAQKIQQAFFPNLSTDYLFESSNGDKYKVR